MTTPQERNGEQPRVWLARELVAADDPETKLHAISGAFNFKVVLAHEVDSTRLLQADQRAAEALEGERRANEKLGETLKVIERALQLSGGWREAVVELEDFCSEPVRLKNMIAAANQIDDWRKEARELKANS